MKMERIHANAFRRVAIEAQKRTRNFDSLDESKGVSKKNKEDKPPMKMDGKFERKWAYPKKIFTLYLYQQT